MMEQDHGCSVDNLYEKCESQFLEMIGVELSKEWKDVDTQKNMKLAKEEENKIFLLEVGEVKF
jgi:hypothetical protein